jgi:hypothetical protein
MCEMGEDVEKESQRCNEGQRKKTILAKGTQRCKQSNAGERLVQKEPQNNAGIKEVPKEPQNNAGIKEVPKGK